MSSPTHNQVSNPVPLFSKERRFARFKVDIQVKVLYRSAGVAKSVSGRGNDLSQGGLAIFAAADFQIGERVEVDFTLPYTRQPLKITAIIRNRVGYRYGVEFATLSAAQLEAIERICQTLSVLA